MLDKNQNEIEKEIKCFHTNIKSMLEELEGTTLTKEDCDDLAKTIKDIVRNAIVKCNEGINEAFKKGKASKQKDILKIIDEQLENSVLLGVERRILEKLKKRIEGK